MKFLLDQGLPRSTVSYLSARGIAASHVGELGMAAATDDAILGFALGTDAVVVTLDADFHSILAKSGAVSPSVIRIRIQGLKGAQTADVIAAAIARVGHELQAGAVVSVAKKSIRVRSLPIRKRP
jgi:predicted nuclease of predicted toxin-antitoxin system